LTEQGRKNVETELLSKKIDESVIKVDLPLSDEAVKLLNEKIETILIQKKE